MFSSADRTVYGRNQILEAVCQFRFPAILSIETDVPAAYQDAVRDVFPRYANRREQQAPKMQMTPGQTPRVESQPPVTNHSFSTADGACRINLTKDFLAVTVNRYTRWEDFARMLDKALYQFIQVYKPALFDRVGLRYINTFSRRALELEETPWRDLIEGCYLGLMGEEAAPEKAFSRCTQDVELSLPGGCRLKLHAGPGLVRRGTDTSDKEVKFVLDLDVSMSGNLPVSGAAGALNTLHAHAWSVFRSAITDTLHDAMEPKEG